MSNKPDAVEAPKDFQEFEKFMGGGEPADTKPATDPGATGATEKEPNAGGEPADTKPATDAGHPADASATDKDAKPGEADKGSEPELTPKQKEHLTKLYNQRDKARGHVTELRKTVATLEAENAALKQRLEAKGAPPAEQTTNPPAPSDAQASAEDPIPERKDYENDEAFEADLDRWYNGEPLQRKAPAADPASQQTKPPDTKPEPDKPAAPDATKDPFEGLPPEERERIVRRGGQIDDLLVTAQKADPDDTWVGKFEELLFKSHTDGGNVIALSDDTLEWMDNHPEDAVKVMQHFADHPEDSRRVARKRTAEQQIERLKAIVKSQTKPKTDPGGSNPGDTNKPEKPGEDEDQIPVIDKLSGTNGKIQEEKKLEDIDNFQEFEERAKKLLGSPPRR